MLKKLILNNFQIHKHLELEFNPGVNTIVGESDSGKSAVIRALNLLLHNQPKGGEKLFQNDQTEEPLVIELHDFNGNVIKRENRTYKANHFLISNFGAQIPEPITELFPFTEINWQFQFDPYFLILDTPGKAAEVLNQATGLADQEMIIDEIKSRISESRKNTKNLLLEKEKLQSKIEQFRKVPHFLMKVRAIEIMQNELKELQNTALGLEDEINDLSACEEELKKYCNLDKWKTSLEKICEANLEYQEQMKIAFQFKMDTAKLRLLEKELQAYTKFDKYQDQIDAILKLSNDLKETQDGKNDLVQCKTILNKKVTESFQMDLIIDDLDLKLKSALKEMGICPLCGSNLKGK